MSAELAAAQGRIAELESELSRLSARDPLVASMMTSAAFRAQLELDVQRARRYGRPLALAVLDIDHFRQLNMQHGYGVGDMVLAAVGARIAAATRAHDLACRAGGDEFALLFPETRAGEAVAVLERIVQDLAMLEVPGVDGVSASAGIAALGATHGGDALLGRAENALAMAQAEGGGRVRLSGGEEADPGDALRAASGEVVAALAQALEERDSYPGAYSESVVDLAGVVAEAVGLDRDGVRTVRTAALFHDIGKVGIPDEILMKPRPLDEREWKLVRQHPVTGERILAAVPGLEPVSRIVRHEHERWDGSGYPDGLAGEAIPVGSRIVLACVAYHAMRSERSHQPALSSRAATAELTGNAGTQFDPAVVETLAGHVARGRRRGLAAV